MSLAAYLALLRYRCLVETATCSHISLIIVVASFIFEDLVDPEHCCSTDLILDLVKTLRAIFSSTGDYFVFETVSFFGAESLLSERVRPLEMIFDFLEADLS